jgi:Ca2+-binding RTX toxin-like protein
MRGVALRSADVQAITGTAGDDALTGTAASDTIQGRAAAALYLVSREGKHEVEAAAAGHDVVSAQAGFALDVGQEIELHHPPSQEPL